MRMNTQSSLNRRRFLSTTAATALGGVLAADTSMLSGARARPVRMITSGIVLHPRGPISIRSATIRHWGLAAAEYFYLMTMDNLGLTARCFPMRRTSPSVAF